MKICTKCKAEKSPDEFYKQSASGDGLYPYCIICTKEYTKNSYKSSRDRRLFTASRWAKANRGRRAAIDKRWYVANPDKIREKSARYWEEHPESVNAKTAKRRATKLQASPLWADKEAILDKYREAKRLSEETGIEYNVDHVVPLQHPLVCGLHVEHNLEAITAKQNQQKGNRVWPDMPNRS